MILVTIMKKEKRGSSRNLLKSLEVDYSELIESTLIIIMIILYTTAHGDAPKHAYIEI